MCQQTDLNFAHEKLEVYQESLAFVAWVGALSERTVGLGEVKDQLDRASTSIPLNIAAGNGKYSPNDRFQSFDAAHGSALECAGGLDLLVARAKLTPEQIQSGKQRLERIVRMLVAMIKTNSERGYGEGKA
jgi:four helix bundle protein